MKVYLAGPVTGMPESNFPAFHKAAAQLRAKGYEVFNPAELAGNQEIEPSGRDTPSLRKLFIDEFTWLIQNAEMIALLPGWENSKGAQAEWAIARAMGIKVRYLD